jgi:phosphoribosylglycinamide formyltransferase-1
MSLNPIPISVFASGRGSNAQAIYRQGLEENASFRVDHILCDQPGAPIIGFCQEQGLHCEVIPKQGNRHHHEQAIHSFLKTRETEWIILAGYQRLLSPKFIQALTDSHWPYPRILNIHPSLLPNYPGQNAYERIHQDQLKQTGVTVHYIDEGVDTGPIIDQISYLIDPAWSLETFVQYGLGIENKFYPQVIQNVLTNYIQKKQGRLQCPNNTNV